MGMTKERKIITPVMKPGNIVFNDKMSTGGRSIKVWGWKSADYDEAQRLLEAAGYTVKRVVTPVYDAGRIYQSGGSIRLHVF